MTNPAPTNATAPLDGQRQCPVCGQPFTRNPRSPTHTYCSDRCRSAAWYQRRGPRRPRSSGTADQVTAVTNAVDTVTAVTNAVDTVTAVTNAVDAGNQDPQAINGANTVQLCPHCRRPIALLTLVVSPTAAHVAVPEPPAVHHRAGQSAPG